jgi:hypothetical protein
MKKAISLIMLVLFSISMVCSQTSVGLKVKSGDQELDIDLNEMNMRAKADINLFNTEIKATYNVDENKLDNLYVKFGMDPADVFMTLELGVLTGKPLEEIANVYKVKKDKGWGVIAKDLGIKPGSPEFHQLKNKAKKNKGKNKNDGHPGKGKGKGKK